MYDVTALTELNRQFIEAFRQGSWDRLMPVLAVDFSYLDGATGEVWPMNRYIAGLDGKPVPGLDIDQVHIHVAGDVAVVSARTSSRPGTFSRYVDTYERRDHGWRCVHACVWPLRPAGAPPIEE
ncbi:MAG: nuclear transport factor 2 family protein [Acidimicrobiales bacterium]